MAKVRNPVTVSGHFGIDSLQLQRLGILHPTLAVDTKLFIDPLLFPDSCQPEIHDTAVRLYREHFEKVIKFLVASQLPGDVAWRTATKLLRFHEIRGTCLGYGANSIHGSGFGTALTAQVVRVGKEIVDLGIRDPDLFPAMALFEANIGPDRVSDMATNVVLRALADLNRRVLYELEVVGEIFTIDGIEGTFLTNPFEEQITPIILVPKDVLRKLPIASDWDGIADAAAQNQALRDQVNQHIGEIWAAKTKRDKGKLRAKALADRTAFQTLLDVVHDVPPRAYPVDADPDGLIKWSQDGKRYATEFPLDLQKLKPVTTLEVLYDVTKQIVERYRQLIEHNGLNKEMYKENGKPRHEKTAQLLFFAIAYCYCEANNIDISPEVDSGSGQIDFKLSAGFDARVLVEVKLSTNSRIISGYETQLEIYKQTEQTMRAIYLVIDVGKMGKKDERLIKVRNAATQRGDPLSDLEFVDGSLKPSASKR